MKTLWSIALVAGLAACETLPNADTAASTLSLSDLRGSWAVQAADPAAGFRIETDSFALDWARGVYVDHARLTFQPDGSLYWEMTQMPELFSERRIDTTMTYGSYHLRHKGSETWLDLQDFDAAHVRLQLQSNTLIAEDPDHHLRLTLVRR